ncbi:hypothetical protein KBB96_08695 [Luteolibacter ambystomatis]|uniref:Uncharacterized protein n=1 Tax=Luteolibacter ambystomatis TaxID=2824561 RepID=A0A975J2W2_9BACT|nr:hypothetical protein [Luteolibacter ambystomatis]QUE52956.1 hypothetical protein KBB96_08695 [Luteolibacter ambystomatis]
MPLETTYGQWQQAVVRKDVTSWQAVTAKSRQMEVRNRLVSEKRAYPAGVFELPAPPPALKGLKFLEAKQKGQTAKLSYFGKIDFGMEGAVPTENLLVLSFIQENTGWKYDRADYINLAALPAVRGELAAGNLRYLEETPDAQPSGVVPPVAAQAPAAKYIAKVYVFCPGREVQVQVNKISRHKFANAKEAEVVIGGAVDGPNEVQYSVKKLDGGTGKEAMTIRVYLLSEVQDVKPIKAFEYQVPENGVPKAADTGYFQVDAAAVNKLMGR